jgi:heme ABC exporter ATP-binding subunit CcmA
MCRNAMPPAVQLRTAVALAGRFPALAGVDLTVECGEVVVVLGANGAGKTSLLRTCAGLMAVTSGEATVLGWDLRAERTEVRRYVGLLGHAAPLYDELTATENVRFAARAVGRRGQEAGPALERMGIVGRLARTSVERLSAGQRRRVALAALIARAPALWLLDEPHAGLDSASRQVLGELVIDVANNGGAVLLTSHEPETAVALADRVVTMSGGRISEERRGKRRPTLTSVKPGDSHVA